MPIETNTSFAPEETDEDDGDEDDNDLPDVEDLIQELTSTIEVKTLRAMLMLPLLHEEARQAIPDLIKIVSTGVPLQRQFAISTLAKIAPDHQEAKDAVMSALDDDSEVVRRATLEALVSFDHLSSEDLARIKSMENDTDPTVAEWSGFAIRNIRAKRNSK